MNHWTANVLPRVYAEYGYYGGQRLALGTFKAIGLAIIGSMLAQYLKDYLRYGKLNPHLIDEGEWFRALEYSSALGIGPEIFEIASGLGYYDFKGEDTGIFEPLTSAPTVSHIRSIGKDINRNLKADDWSGLVEDFIRRAVPFQDVKREEE